jgi:ParB/Sulfiredoxin domain
MTFSDDPAPATVPPDDARGDVASGNSLTQMAKPFPTREHRMSVSACRSEPMTATLPIGTIGIPEGHRATSKSKVRDLAESILADGLLQPIGVRSDPADPGRYILVFGRHRLEAARSLNWPSIEARVLDLDDDSAEMATIAENLFRSPLKKSDYFLALKKWNDSYSARFPETTEHRAGGKARGRQRREDSRPEVAETDASASVPTFAEHAAETLGVSPVTVRRDVRAAKRIGEEGLGVLNGRDLSPELIRKVADLKAPEHRVKAVELIKAGMDPTTALAMATAPENATLEHVDVDNSAYVPEEDHSDEDWLEKFCPEALARLPYQVAFRRDALIWRKCRPAITEFRNKTRKSLAQSRGYHTGPFQYRAINLVNVLHPDEWPRCGPCGGTGQAGNISQCPNCHGAGFSIKTGAAR